MTNAWRACVITLMPEMYPGPLGASLIGDAQARGLWELSLVNLRQFGIGPHQKVDDTPYGGGAGMVLKPDVVDAAIEYAKSLFVSYSVETGHPSLPPLAGGAGGGSTGYHSGLDHSSHEPSYNSEQASHAPTPSPSRKREGDDHSSLPPLAGGAGGGSTGHHSGLGQSSHEPSYNTEQAAHAPTPNPSRQREGDSHNPPPACGGSWRGEHAELAAASEFTHDSLAAASELAGHAPTPHPSRWREGDSPLLIHFTPRGEPLTQAHLREFSQTDVILLCGRYEAIDQRVLDKHQPREISLGDFVLTGGDIPAMALIDGCVRLLPGVIGKEASLGEESFGDGPYARLLEYPHYTKPAEWDGRAVPHVLMSGHHADIAKWRQAEAEAVTRARRPDLLKRS